MLWRRLQVRVTLSITGQVLLGEIETDAGESKVARQFEFCW